MSSSTTALDLLTPRLAAWLGAPVARIAILDSGWETTIYEFTIGARSPRTPDLPVNSPLVLRLFDGVRAEDKAAREGRMFFYLAGAKYPVPRPYLYETTRAALGAPFLLMDRVAGGPLFSATSFPVAFKTFSLGFIAFVRAQVRLHRMDATGPDVREPNNPNRRGDITDSDGLPQSHVSPSIPAAAPLLDRMLAIIADRVAAGPLPGLNDALISLRERAGRYRPAPAAPPPAGYDALASPRARAGRSGAEPDSIVHMDYHPQNVIVRGMRVTGVIDWVSADRGDRHLDAATTSAILATSAMDHPRWMRDNPAGNSLRALFAGLYFPAYHALAPMELDRFRYCQAVAALFRLSTFGMMRARGPESVGYRPAAIANVTPDVVRLLCRYTSRKSGTPASLPPAS
ncbi:MAG: aminoglycoside phosphotransferase family protein [Candidatus Binataceae bacterium]